MEVYERLDDLVDLIEGARGFPLSDSCVVNRPITLEFLDAVRALMPASLRDAAQILADRDDVLEDAAREAESQVTSARDQADAILAAAQADAAALIAAAQADADGLRDHAQREAQDTGARARGEAEQALERARLEAERMVAADTIRLEAERQARVISQHAEADASRVRAEADIYVDKRLAQLEDTLRAALDQVGRGRRRASAAATAPEPAARPAGGPAPAGEFYDFAQDPEVAGELVGGRRRSR